MSVYDSIREGMLNDWRKAQLYDDMKFANHNLCYGLERALLILSGDEAYQDDALKRNVIEDAKRFIKDARDRGFIA